MRLRRLLALLLVLASLALVAAADEAAKSEAKTEAKTAEALGTRSGPLLVARIAGSINPASADYLMRAIATSEEEAAVALLIELDTPGGLVASTKDIIQAMLNSQVPIIVYVAPQGAWAGSAGTFITMAAHIAAMAPGSSIGAAHPVGIGGGGGGSQPSGDGEGKPVQDHSAQKAENLLAAFIESIAQKRHRNVEWASKAVRESVAVTAEEALELNVVDIVARDRADLLVQIEELPVELGTSQVLLSVVSASQRLIEMSPLTRLINVIVDPNVAVLLLMAGLLGLYIEFNQPGLLIPGIAGAICLLLAMIAMQILPFSWLGLMLMLAGIALFAAEVFVTSYGMLFVGGVICFLLGGSMLFDKPDVSDLNVSFWSVLVPAVAGVAFFGGIVVYAVGRSIASPPAAGAEAMVGMIGIAADEIGEDGTVFIHGEHWRARSEDPIPTRERVEVVAVDGLLLTVRRAEPRT